MGLPSNILAPSALPPTLASGKCLIKNIGQQACGEYVPRVLSQPLAICSPSTYQARDMTSNNPQWIFLFAQVLALIQGRIPAFKTSRCKKDIPD